MKVREPPSRDNKLTQDADCVHGDRRILSGKDIDDDIEAEVEGDQISKLRRVKVSMNVVDEANRKDKVSIKGFELCRITSYRC